MKPTFFAALLCLLVPGWAAADTALILSNARYEAAQNLRYGGDIPRLNAPFTEAGLDVIGVQNGDTSALRDGLADLLDADEINRVVIVLSGHIVHSDTRSWLLGVETRAPSLATVDAQGVSLDVVMDIASAAPGRAVVLVATEARRIALGAGLRPGLGEVAPPQGVTVITGPPQSIAEFARNVVLQPGGDLAATVGAARNLTGYGFLSSTVSFYPETSAPIIAPTPISAEEQALWDAAVEIDRYGAYQAYLNAYPVGAFAAQARTRMQALEVIEDPAARAEAEEEALGLDRNARRELQRALSILDYDTRGIDGIFGPGTRGAIRGWQAANGRNATGYLTVSDLPILRQQAATRAAVLAEEARRRQEERDRADRAYWQALGQGQTETALRQYLERYPDGLFSDVAQDRLDQIEADRRAVAEAAERADWDAVRAVDTIGAYNQYLAAYPEGLFRDIAYARISELEGRLSPAEQAEAEAREAALNLQPVMRLMVERRLASMGLEPGRLDSTFDADARRAIRRYQDARGLTATGYLDQPTVVRLLAEAIGARIVE